ncbi:MAG: EamA family transporter [Spirochaetota bacterium]
MKSDKSLSKESILIFLSYGTIYIVWGSTYFFIRMAVQTIPPFYVVGFRFVFGGVFFMILSLITGRLKTLPSLKEVLATLILSTLLLLGGNGLVTIAEQELSSYLTALIIATTPIVIAVFNRVLFKMGVSGIRLFGILIGIAGVGFLLYDGQSILTSLKPGVLMVWGGTLSWGFATSIGHRVSVPKDNFVNSGIQMLFAGIVSLVGVTLSHQPLPHLYKSFSFSSMVGVAYLAVVGSLAFGAYNYLIAHEPSIRIVSYSLVNPVIAVLLGILIGNEEATPYLLIGLPFVLTGLFFMLYGEYLLKRIGNRKQ